MAPVTLSWVHIPAWIWDFPVPTKELLPTFGSQVCYPKCCAQPLLPVPAWTTKSPSSQSHRELPRCSPVPKQLQKDNSRTSYPPSLLHSALGQS